MSRSVPRSNSGAVRGNRPARNLDELWADMVLDACASDGPIRDADVRSAMKWGRQKIEAAIRTALLTDSILTSNRLVSDQIRRVLDEVGVAGHTEKRTDG